MTKLTIRHLGPGFGTEIEGFEPAMLADEPTATKLLELFDTRGVLVFRDLDISHAEQVEISLFLIRRASASTEETFNENWYVSNRRPDSAAPHGRLQFHIDTAWAHEPNQVVSLYATELEPPVAPTNFVSATKACRTLPDELRARIAGKEVILSAGQIRRRGDVSDVLLSEVKRPPCTRKPVVLRHPRTGEPILYVCEQNTREIVGMSEEEGEELLEALFTHLYSSANRWDFDWRLHDLAVWDNLAIQHARPNVPAGGRARTLRKVAAPMPPLDQDELPSYVAAS
jgi:alpha-ketoglutarate-dependent taurine dioxygenase